MKTAAMKRIEKKIEKTMEIVKAQKVNARHVPAGVSYARASAAEAIDRARQAYAEKQAERRGEELRQRYTELGLSSGDFCFRHMTARQLGDLYPIYCRYWEEYSREYTDELCEALKAASAAVRGLKSDQVDVFQAIEAIWRKPRRVDLKDIRIPLDKRHRKEIEAAIDQVQQQVSVRTIDVDDIYDTADWIRERYKGVPRAALAGSSWIVDDNAQHFAKAYTNNFTPMSTIYRVEATAHKLYVTAIYRGRCEAKQIWTSLSDAAEAALKEKAGESA